MIWTLYHSGSVSHKCCHSGSIDQFPYIKIKLGFEAWRNKKKEIILRFNNKQLFLKPEWALSQ